jgi:hypothetical protein
MEALGSVMPYFAVKQRSDEKAGHRSVHHGHQRDLQLRELYRPLEHQLEVTRPQCPFAANIAS